MLQQYLSKSPDDTIALAKKIAKDIQQVSLEFSKNNYIIYLDGELGTGKTFFSQFFIKSFGNVNRVKSPTYTLIEHYEFNTLDIYHLDLYRLADPDEYNFLGVDDLLNNKNNKIFLIEWPEKAGYLLPKADLTIKLSYDKDDNQNYRNIIFDYKD